MKPEIAAMAMYASSCATVISSSVCSSSASRRAETFIERSRASMAGLTASLPMRRTPSICGPAAPPVPSADNRRFNSSFRRSLR
jgi:hypothetical protein